ncbi:MAG: redoxin domain-containing protein [Dehalococcoidia bacterium]
MTTERPRPAMRSPLEGPFPTGPEVGERTPEFTLVDQAGREVSFPSAAGEGGAVIVFHRGAAWCPFCRTQVLEMQRRLGDFEAAGVTVMAISPDPPQALVDFAAQQGVTFPLLSDADSSVIRRFGILNTLIDPDEPFYGIPYPGVYVTDSEGVVRAKFFRRYYRERDTAETVLHEGLQIPVDMSANPAGRDGAEVSAVLGAPALAFRQRANVYVRIALEAGTHANGPAVAEGLIPTSVTVRAPEQVGVGEAVYPSTRPFVVSGVAEPVPVFEGDVEIAVPIVSKFDEGESFPLEVEVRYQACTERECLLPRTQVVRLEVPIVPLNRPPRRE